MQKWQYMRIDVEYSIRHGGVTFLDANGVKILSEAKTEQFFEYLQILGGEGWDLASSHRGDFTETIYFKRPIPSTPN